MRLALVVTLLATPAWATPPGWAPLLDPAPLAALIDALGEDLRVLHVSGTYDAGHIPGAGWSPYAAWRGPDDNPGALRDLGRLTATIQDLGIEAETPVVIVHAGTDPADMGSAARVLWTLRSLGVQDLAILNGGYAAWVDAGLPIETAPVSFFPSDFVPEWTTTWTATTDQVADLSVTGGARLIDARPPEFFWGIDWNIARPGTIPGAENRDYTDLFDGARMISADRVAALAADWGVTGDAPVVAFCNTGHWSAVTWFALSEVAGLPGIALYPDSLGGWDAAGLPTANTPGRVLHHWRLTTRWLAGLAG